MVPYHNGHHYCYSVAIKLKYQAFKRYTISAKRQSLISDFSRAVQSHCPLRCRIACAKKFSEYYLRLPGILNDPVCCMTLLAIEWSLLQ